jgi:hypothetical protein
MPDTPGSGPPDPEIVYRALHDAATWEEGHLLLPRGGGPRWLAVVQRDGGRVWELSITRGVEISEATAKEIAAARLHLGRLYLGGLAFGLIPPSPDAAEQLAILMPA